MRPESQPSSAGSAGEAVAGHRRHDQVERVLGVAAVRGRVGERADCLEQLDDRARPPVGHDQRQGVLVRRPHVDEVDVHAVDLGHELRQRVELRLALAPVVLRRPVVGQRLSRRQLHALRAVVDELPGRPARRRDATEQVVELLVWDLEVEGPDLGCGCDGTHDDLLVRSMSSASGSPPGARWRTAPAAPRRRSGRPCRLR